MKFLAVALMFTAASAIPATADGLKMDGTPLVSADGATLEFSPALFNSEVTVISFTFTGCRSICPVSDLVMSQVQDEAIGSGLDLARLTFTIDPLNDSPAVLAAHREKYGFDQNDNWQWLSGEPEAIWNVLDHLGMEAGSRDDHESYFIVVGRNGTRARSLWESTATAETIVAAAREIALAD